MKTVTIPADTILDLFSNDAYFTVNKKLLAKFGPNKAVYLSNLVDKYRYFKRLDLFDDYGRFYLKMEEQSVELGLSVKQLRSIREYFTELGVIKVDIYGIPKREWFSFNLGVLLDLLEIEGFEHISQNRRQCSGKNGMNVQANRSQLYKEQINKPKYKKNKEKKDFEPKDEPKDDPNQTKYEKLSKKLKNIIQSKKRIELTNSQTNMWALEIKKLCTQNKIEAGRIREALNWYADHIGEPFVPVIESGKSLRTKFLNLEMAIDRETKYRPQNNRRPANGSMTNLSDSEMANLAAQYD